MISGLAGAAGVYVINFLIAASGIRMAFDTRAFKRFWRRRSCFGRSGRPGLDREVVRLVRRMAQANVTWGAPRIRNELGMLGIEVAVSTVAKYMSGRIFDPRPG